MAIVKRIVHSFLKSSLYYYSLGKPQYNRIYSIMSYKRKGSSEKGLKILLNKQFDYGGQSINVDNFKSLFKRCKNRDSAWANQINSFAWIRDLSEVESNNARICARNLIKAWIKENSRWSEINWSPSRIGERLFFLLSFYDFYGRSADNSFKQILFSSIYKQEKHLKKTLKKQKDKDSYNYLQAVKGLIFANIYFIKNSEGLKENLINLEKSIKSQILADGCHKSRNIFVSFKILRTLMEVEYALKNSRKAQPEFLKTYIHLITRFIKSVMYKDGCFPIFNGSFEYDIEKIQDVMKKIDFRLKTIKSFPISGYEKIQEGKTNILISTATEDTDNRHLGAGSFEMQYDKNRMLVNCGAFIHEPKWQEALQETNAHSTLIINNDDNLANRIDVFRRDNKKSTSISMQNKGYEKNCRTHLSRKLFVSNSGQTIIGTDIIKNTISKDVVIRFHLHPDVVVTEAKNKKHLFLKVGKNTNWIFKTSEDSLFIEESVYFGKGKFPQQTKQIVIREKVSKGETEINWLFEKI